MWGWSNSGVWLCSTCRYAVLDFAMPYNLDKACPNCSELTRLRARIEELEARNIELVGRMTALGQHHALRAAERRVAELERAIWRVRKRFQAFPGDDDESDVFWAAIRLLFAALDAAEGEG